MNHRTDLSNLRIIKRRLEFVEEVIERTEFVLEEDAKALLTELQGLIAWAIENHEDGECGDHIYINELRTGKPILQLLEE